MGRSNVYKRLAEGLSPVAAYEVAPHRYLWNAPVADPMPFTWREVRDAAPYKVGDVVFVVHGDTFRRAYIATVGVDKDSWDDWRECYHVLPETKAGRWSKVYYIAHPGYIQRGYQRAGLAPEMPKDNEGGKGNG